MDTHGISRVTRSKQEARLAYNRMSRWYDSLAGGSEQNFMKLGIRQLSPVPGEHILEIGCGTGHGLLSLAKSVSASGHIVGLDISEGMLVKARTLLAKTNSSNPVDLQLGDACQLPYATNSFSAVFFCFSLELFDTPEIPQVLSECARILRENGRIGIVNLSKQDTLLVRIYEWFHQKMPSLIDCRPILVKPFLSLTGFEIITSEIKNMWGLPVEIVTAKVL
jgi:demethylmenaquinone methyltransferase/2-methoxy-6-polyprenyl-1,4-benzoquinol methylase